MASIHYTASDIDSLKKNDNLLYKRLTSLDFGSTLQVPIWGRADIEGQLICKKFNVKLHVIEKQTIQGKAVWVHQLIDTNTVQTKDPNYQKDDDTIHIINEGSAHFKPILRTGETQRVQKVSSSYSSNYEDKPQSVISEHSELKKYGLGNEQPIGSRVSQSDSDEMIESSDYEYDQNQIKLNEDMMRVIRSDESEEVKLKEINDFLDKGANVNFEDANHGGNTPLHAAVRKGENQVVELLISRGANITIKNNGGKTPLDIAKQKRDKTTNGQRIVNILEEHVQSLSLSFGQQASAEHPPMEIDSAESIKKRPSDGQLGNSNLKKQKFDEHSWKMNPTHEAGELKRSFHGDNYQLALLILFAWRYKTSVVFRLGTEVAEGGKFDDLVLRYIDNKDSIRYRFLQAKHVQHLTEKHNIKDSDFFSSSDSDFSLKKYFLSYMEIESRKEFQDGSMEDVILSTNRNLDESVEHYFDEIVAQDEALNLGGKRYRFKQTKRDEIIQELSKILNKSTRSGTLNKHTDEKIGEFLDKLVFAVGQPSGRTLDNIIKKEIGGEFNLINDVVYNNFYKFMSEWMEHREKGEKGPGRAHFLEHDDLEKFVNDAKIRIAELVAIGPTSLHRLKIKEYGVAFDETHAIKALKRFLTSNDKQIFNLVTQKTLLGAIKVDQALDDMTNYKEEDSHIFVNLGDLLILEDRLMEAFSSETNNLLVIKCGSTNKDIQALYDKLSQILQRNNNKKVILITKKDESNDLVKKLEEYFYQGGEYEKENDRDNGFKYLNTESKEKISNKNVIFQGKPKKLRDLLDSKSLEESIGASELIELVTSDEISIGKAFEFSYVPNGELDRKWKSSKVSVKVLSETDNKDNFILEVIGGEEKDYSSFQEKLRKTHNNQKIFVYSSSSVKSEFHKSTSESDKGNVYWLEAKFSELQADEDAKLEFKWSNGNLDILCRDENFQIDGSDRAFIIYGESGIGKTVFLNELYYKYSQSLYWVIDIDLSSSPHGIWSNKGFSRNDKGNIDSFIKVLKELGKLNSKLEASLFRSALQNKGVELVIFFDSFEKIGSSDQDAVLLLLKTLKEDHVGVKKLAVATRSYKRYKLEDTFSIFGYQLPMLEGDSAQIKILKHFLKNKGKDNVNKLINLYKEKNIDISFPISLEVLSSLSEETLKTFGNDPDLAELINKYVEKKVYRSVDSGEKEHLMTVSLEVIKDLAISQFFGITKAKQDKKLIGLAKDFSAIGSIFYSNRDTDSPVLRPIIAESLVKNDPTIQGIIEQRREKGFDV